MKKFGSNECFISEFIVINVLIVGLKYFNTIMNRTKKNWFENNIA